MITVYIASNKDIEDSRDQWNSLVYSMKFPSVFLTWEWINTWIRCFSEDYSLLIFFIYKSNRLSAILPLAMKEIKSFGGISKIRMITLCGGIELYPDYMDIICAESDNADIYIDAVMEKLKNVTWKWDIMYLPFLSEQGNLSSWLKKDSSRFRIRKIDSRAPYIRNESGYDDFLGKMNSKKRYNLRRERRILLEKNNITFQRATTTDELNDGMEVLFKLHEKRAVSKGIRSTFAVKEICSFHKEITSVFSDKGWMRLYTLEGKKGPIASLYGFVFKDRFSFYQMGIEPQWLSFSPGKILILMVIEELFNEGIKVFDFLGGNDGYKDFWAKKSLVLSTYTLYNITPLGLAEYYSNTLSRLAVSLLKTTPMFNILKKVKSKLWN